MHCKKLQNLEVVKFQGAGHPSYSALQSSPYCPEVTTVNSFLYPLLDFFQALTFICRYVYVFFLFRFCFCFLLLISRISHYIYHYLYFLSTFLKTVYFCLALLSQPAIFYVGIIWNFVLDLCVHVCACVHAWVCVCVISFITNYPSLTEDLCVLLIWWLFATSCLIFTSTCVFEYMDVW